MCMHVCHGHIMCCGLPPRESPLLARRQWLLLGGVRLCAGLHVLAMYNMHRDQQLALHVSLSFPSHSTHILSSLHKITLCIVDTTEARTVAVTSVNMHVSIIVSTISRSPRSQNYHPVSVNPVSVPRSCLTSISLYQCINDWLYTLLISRWSSHRHRSHTV